MLLTALQHDRKLLSFSQLCPSILLYTIKHDFEKAFVKDPMEIVIVTAHCLIRQRFVRRGHWSLTSLLLLKALSIGPQSEAVIFTLKLYCINFQTDTSVFVRNNWIRFGVLLNYKT